MPLPDKVLNQVLAQLTELKIAPIAVWSFDSDSVVRVKLRDQTDLDTVTASGRLQECDLTVMLEKGAGPGVNQDPQRTYPQRPEGDSDESTRAH